MKKANRPYFEDIRGWSQDHQVQTQEQALGNLIYQKSALSTLPEIDRRKVRLDVPQKVKEKQISPFRRADVEDKESLKKVKEFLQQQNPQCQRVRSQFRFRLLQVLQEEQQTARQNNLHRNEVKETDHHLKFYPNQNANSQPKIVFPNKLNPLQGRINTVLSNSCQKDKIPDNFDRYNQQIRLEEVSARQRYDLSVKSPEKVSTITYILKSMKTVSQEYPSMSQKSRLKTNHCKSINLDDPKSKKGPGSKTKLQKIEKANERFKQTFFKQDALIKLKKKEEKGLKASQMGQFNDQDIFSDNNAIGNLSRFTPPLKQPALALKVTKNKSLFQQKLLII